MLNTERFTHDDLAFLDNLSGRLCAAFDLPTTQTVEADAPRKPCPGCQEQCSQCGDEALD